MKVQEILDKAQDSMNVKKVFGEPLERDGLIIIPAARVSGGGGGGDDGGDAGGTGFGVAASPTGVFVIKDGEVRWEPVVDLNRLAMVAIVALLVLRSVVRSLVRLR